MAESELQLLIGGQFYPLLFIAAFLVYIFAAGKIADSLAQLGRKLTRKEALLAPFAFLFSSAFCILLYFGSGNAAPPQNTIIANGVFLLLIPLAIAVGAGALSIHAFFHNRLRLHESIHLSLQILLAPIFDGLAGYWTGMGAAALLVLISGVSFWSSGGSFSLVTTDFVLLSAVVAIYYIYKALIEPKSEGKASSLILALVIAVPGVLRLFFKDLACAMLSYIPLQFFKSCPLYQAGNEVTLALSVLATLVLIVPVIPIIYAAVVNAMRAASLIGIIFQNEAPARAKRKEED
jgi:hypothetical protein